MSPLVWVPKDQIPLLGPLEPTVEIAPTPDDPLADSRIGDVEFFVVRIIDKIPPLVEAMTSLKVVQTVGAGVNDFIDGFPSHVTLCSAKGAHDIDVAEWVLAAILIGQRDLWKYRDQQHEEVWGRTLATRLHGQSVMLLGYGSIARAVEERLAGFGVRIIRVARRAHDGVESVQDLATLLTETEVLVVLTALTPETYHLLDAAMLSALPDDALIVNAARGPIIDTDALLAELVAGRLRAVIDVTDPEPLPPGHPLWKAPGLLITPHTAGGTKYASVDTYRLITDQINRYARGETMQNVVTDGY